MTVRHLICSFVGVAIAALAAGCRGGSLPPAANADTARSALATSLETWKNGGNSRDTLAGGRPPIFFNEPNCRPDVQLLDFHIEDSHVMFGQSVQLAVSLSIKRPDGSIKKKKSLYLVDTAPAIVIVPG